MTNLLYDADIAFEIAGSAAMLMRPDTGSTPIYAKIETRIRKS